ncbi:DUF4326 domain-containing protein [Humibacter sp. RRB41]|uniref:DUF4326 domain-containing protein n=1 Tax=Humibacter sp. RRB41 TaxID=2919946 RepID=UPI001FAAC012|nr:DUF4326 domain-containing protein [Humibacter sp. RRB41]
MPERVQLRRTKGWRKPENTVVVARPSKWGNPYSVERYGRDAAIGMFRLYAIQVLGSERIRDELAGHNLACWCRLDQPCHADVLLELANA